MSLNTSPNNQKTLFSACSPFAKTSYELLDELSIQYDSLSFVQKDSFVSCVSTQIGCPEKCAFCATWDKEYVRNLTKEQMVGQYRQSLKLYPTIAQSHQISKFVIVLEWMGEASFNMKNALDALLVFYPEIAERFDDIKFSVSTSWRLISARKKYQAFIQEHQHKMPKLHFDLQFSLHTPIEQERSSLVPNIHKQYTLSELLHGKAEIPWLYAMSESLWEKLKINYMLLNYPDWMNNYSDTHIQELQKILLPAQTKIKLTMYSETHKWFTSPDERIYDSFKNTLESAWFEVEIVPIQWVDVYWWCWMLDYQSKKEFMYDKYVAQEYTSFWNDSNKTQSLWYAHILDRMWDISWKQILDYGCGTWEFTKIMSQSGWNVVWTDISSDMLNIAKTNDALSKYCSVSDLWTIGGFDFVTSNYVFCVIENKEKIKNILSFLCDQLLPGGKLFIQNANRDEANWMDFASFSLVKKEWLKDGDEIFAVLKNVPWSKDLIVKDHFHSLSIYEEIFAELGICMAVRKLSEGDISIAPIYVIEATKPKKTSLRQDDVLRLQSVTTFEGMADIALETLERIGGGCVQVCWPITTWWLWSAEKNIQEMEKYIYDLSLTINVFNQLEYFTYFEKLIDKNVEYDTNPLEKFYLRLFSSGLITTCYFLPWRETSRWAVWEHEIAKKIWITIKYIQ